MRGKDRFSEFMEEESFIHVAKVCVCVSERERKANCNRGSEYYAANIDGLC